MKLWLLQRIDEDESYYDEAFGFVIRAETGKAARLFASKDAGDEGSITWLDPTLTTCRSISDKGSPRIILRDFLAG
jgi:hypothetical protein